MKTTPRYPFGCTSILALIESGRGSEVNNRRVSTTFFSLDPLLFIYRVSYPIFAITWPVGFLNVCGAVEKHPTVGSNSC
jgi:hypothetical protein